MFGVGLVGFRFVVWWVWRDLLWCCVAFCLCDYVCCVLCVCCVVLVVMWCGVLTVC